MLNDFKDSIKAKLYDFNYTPFMSSLVISWIVINHKYLLVLLSDKIDVDKKLIMLNDTYSYNAVFGYCSFYIAPLLFALFYVFIYPKISKYFYEYTLRQTKKLKEIKQKIEDETPLTQEEARWHRIQIEKLNGENNDLRARLASAVKTYEDKLKKQIELETTKAREENIALQGRLDDAHAYGEGLHGEIRNKEKEIDFLKQELEALKNDDVDKNKEEQEDDRMKILRYIYESNYVNSFESDAINKIISATKIPLVVVTKILKDLISEVILTKTFNNAQQKYVIGISEKGSEYLMGLFYKK